MNEESNVKKNNKLSYAELYLFTVHLVGCLRRDIATLEDFGITEAKITALNAMNEEVNALPSDELLKSDYYYAVAIKNSLREEVEKVTKRLGIRAKEAFHNNPARINALYFQDIAIKTDTELYEIAVRVHDSATKFLNDLKDEGVTQEKLDAFKLSNESFKEAIIDSKEKATVRLEATQTRIEKSNKLYTKISMYCEYGKTAFENVNPARYNDYVIYAPSAGALKPPTNLEFRPKEKFVMWDIVKYATSYELEYSSDGDNWTEVYSGSDIYTSYTPPVEGWAYFRVRARNINGFGEYSAVLKSGFYHILPPPSNIQATLVAHSDNELDITWDLVPSALVYKIYSSVVPIGAAPNSFNFVAKVTENSYRMQVERGKRHYYFLTAESHTQWSSHSPQIFIDVE